MEGRGPRQGTSARWHLPAAPPSQSEVAEGRAQALVEESKPWLTGPGTWASRRDGTPLGWAGASLVVGPPRVRRRRRFSGDQLFISCFKGGDKFHCLISVIVIFNSLSSMFFLICWIFVACVHVCNPFYFLSVLTYIL